MFTGIVREIGKIEKIETHEQKRYYTIACKDMQSDLSIGESIACDGICLTVTKFTPKNITIQIMNETAKITTATHWKINKQIHLERALAVTDRLNGHIVQGHIDTTTYLHDAYRQNNTLYLEFYLPQDFAPLIVEHGSICIDGVSLTVTNCDKNSFKVALIEHTLKTTHFNTIKKGDKVNLEFDIIAKYIQKNINTNNANKNNITQEWLIKQGF